MAICRKWKFKLSLTACASILATVLMAQAAIAGTSPKAFPLVSAGGTHTCAIKVGAGASCWGNDVSRQATVAATLGSVRAVSAGLNHSCFITGAPGDSRAQVKASCFGDNTQKQSTVPSDLLSVIKVAAGFNHNCAIKARSTDSSGVVRCWGANEFLQSTGLPADIGKTIDGSGNVLNASGETINPSGKVVDIAAGGFHSCAVRVDQTVRCWGGNIYGQRNIPGGLSGVTQVSAGYDFSCALKSDKTITCWGGNSAIRTSVAAPIDPPAELTDPATADITQISAGAFHVCVVRTSGSVICWGEPPNHPQTPPAGLLPVVSVSAGKSASLPHTCSVATNGTIACWGDDAFADVSGINQADFGSLMTATVSTAGGATVDLGLVAAGSGSSPTAVSITNTTPVWITNKLQLTSISVSSATAGPNPFSATSSTCDGGIESGSSCSVFVFMAPKPWQRGPFSGSLTINDLAAGSPRTFALKGIAMPPSSFVLANAAAVVTPVAVNLTWDTSDNSTVTITATPSTPGGKATLLATLKKQPAKTLAFAWNRKIGKLAAGKGNWTINISGSAANGTASASLPITLN